MEVEGAQGAVNLIGFAEADDGGGDGGVVESPGEGDFTGCFAVGLTDFGEEIDEGEIAGEVGFLEIFIAAAPVVGGEMEGAFASHFAGEQSGAHG